MSSDYEDVNKRYDLFWLGMSYERENNLQKAIDTFLLYADALAPKDRYLPHIWISGIYNKLDQPTQALFHLEEFARGCSENRAALIWKDIGKKYLEINDLKKAIYSFEEAIKHDDTIGVKKLLDHLKKSVYG